MPDSILLQLQSQRNPRIGAVVRIAMFGMAILLVVVAVALPYFGVLERGISYWLCALAAVDVVMGFVMPPVIEKQSVCLYRFYKDRLEIQIQGQSYSLPYDNIDLIEEAGSLKDAEHSLTLIRLTTKSPVSIPFFGIGKTVNLASLAVDDSPYARIKEVVEKSRAA